MSTMISKRFQGEALKSWTIKQQDVTERSERAMSSVSEWCLKVVSQNGVSESSVLEDVERVSMREQLMRSSLEFIYGQNWRRSKMWNKFETSRSGQCDEKFAVRQRYSMRLALFGRNLLVDHLWLWFTGVDVMRLLTKLENKRSEDEMKINFVVTCLWVVRRMGCTRSNLTSFGH